MVSVVDMVGKRFNRLTVISRVKNNTEGQAVWLCECDCGNKKEYVGIGLRSKPPLSCGCELRKSMANLGGFRENSGRKPKKLIDKIRYTIDESTGCWVWQGNKGKSGCDYGRVSHEGKYIMAHRAAYMAFVGEIPEGMLICHKCDNRSCVNPNHLFIGTASDNMQDMLRKGRGRYQK